MKLQSSKKEMIVIEGSRGQGGYKGSRVAISNKL